MNLDKALKDIIKITLLINVVLLFIIFFNFSKRVIILVIILNVILLGTFMIISKYYIVFWGITQSNKFANKLNKELNNRYG